MADTAKLGDQLKQEVSRIEQIEEIQTGMLNAAVVNGQGGRLTDDETDKFDKLSEEADKCLDNARRLQSVLAREGQVAELHVAPGRDSGHDGLDTGSHKVDTDPFGGMGEYLQAIAKCSGLDRPAELMEKLAPTGSSSGIDSDGGFMVRKGFATQIWKRMYDRSLVGGRAQHIPIGANEDGLKWNAIQESSRADGSRSGGIRAYWTGEAAQMTNTKAKLEQHEIVVQDLTGMWYATDRLLRDQVALQALHNEEFSNEFAFKIDDALINGDGAGKPVGILNADCLITIAKETGQAAATIEYDNIVKMWARLWARSRANSVWFCNQDVDTQLMTMAFPVGTGGLPAFLPPGGASSTPYSTLFGRPVIPIEQCPTLGTKGDLLLCDMSAYRMVEKGGMESDSSIHLRFDYNETAFRYRARLNGQPLWKSALTPYKGSNTLSPFVALATRS